MGWLPFTPRASQIKRRRARNIAIKHGSSLRLSLLGTAVSCLMLGIFSLSVVGHAQGSIQITGAVTAPSGAGVGNVSVYATDPGVTGVNNAVYGPTTTATDGTYTLDVDAGTYDFHFDPSSGSGYNSVVDSNVSITSGQTINVQFTPITHIFSGNILDNAGNPVPGVDVDLTCPDGSHNVLDTDQNGHFSITADAGVCTGLSFSYSPNGNPDTNEFTGLLSFNLSDSDANIDLTNADVSQNFQLTPATVTVTVKDSNGNPITNTPLSVNTQSGSASLLPTGSSGSYSFSGSVRSSGGSTDPTNGVAQFTMLAGFTFGQESGAQNSNDNICAFLNGGGLACLASPLTVSENTNVVIQQVSPIPPSPTNLSAPSPTNQYPSLSWNTVSGATSYNIYRNGANIASITAPTTTYTDSSLATNGTQDGTYTYTVTAVNSAGESPQSSPATVVYDTTPPVVTITGVVNGETYSSNNVPTPVCHTTDALSGVATSATLSMFNAGNSYTTTCSGATDNAGNTAQSVSATYTVLPSNYTLVNLTNSNSNNLSNAKVTIENSSSQITTLSTDSFGNTYLNTTPGTYKVTVYYANGYESQTIHVTANGPNNINFTTVPVTVTINDPNTTDLSNATVAQAGNTGTFGVKTPVNSNGQITFQVLPGTNSFTAYVANGYQEQSITATTGTNNVTFNTDSVQVTVTKNGNPLTTATVKHAGNTGSYGTSQSVNSSGQYTFYVLPGTNYFEAFDGPNNHAEQTLSVTGDTSTTIAVN